MLLVMAATITSWRTRLYALELMTTAGRSFIPDSSENTNPTNTTSPRS